MRRAFLAIALVAVLTTTASSVGAWWTPYRAPLRPVAAYRFELVAPDGVAQGLFDGAWQAAFPAKAQTCEFAVRDVLVHAEQGGWDIATMSKDLRAVASAGENRSPCYIALYVRGPSA